MNSKNIKRLFPVVIAISGLMTFVQAQQVLGEQSDEKAMIKGTAKIESAAAMSSSNPLMDDYDVKFYKLDLKAVTSSEYLDGSTTIMFEVQNNPLSTFVAELTNYLDVTRVLVDDIDAAFVHTNHEVSVTLQNQAAIGELHTVEIFYEGFSGPGPGMTSMTDGNWGVPITFTLSEPFYAYEWFACKQSLDDKADSVHVFITTDFGLKGVSQGLLTGTTYLPNGDVRHEWKSNYPIAYYLISIAVADYQEYNIEAIPEGTDTIFIQNFLYNVEGCLENYQDNIDATIDIMEVFTELFGPYPFLEEKYGHYLWPWGGGMEHQTMTGMGAFPFFLIAHELGHSWFGDYVTCGTWQDIWINEGFATFAEYMATEKIAPAFAKDARTTKFDRAMLDSLKSVFIPEQEALTDNRIFSGILSYNKGMALLYMLRFEIDNDDLFFEGIRDYLDLYGHGFATGMDFKQVMENKTGMDLTQFFNQWYFGAGFPIYEVSWEQTDQTVTIHSMQTTTAADPKLFKMSMEYQLKYSGGDTIVRVFQDANDQSFDIDVSHVITSVVVDPNEKVLNRTKSVKKILGIDEKQLKFALYPNPNSGVFTVETASENIIPLNIEVFNGMSQLVYSRSIGDGGSYSSRRIDLGPQPPGVYLVRIQTFDDTYVKKIIIE